jgi:hypothetical protein
MTAGKGRPVIIRVSAQEAAERAPHSHRRKRHADHARALMGREPQEESAFDPYQRERTRLSLALVAVAALFMFAVIRHEGATEVKAVLTTPHNRD